MLENNENIDYEIEDSPIQVLGIGELLDIAEEESNSLIEEEPTVFLSGLASHIIHEFQINRDARRNSLAEQDIIDSLRQYNGEYSGEDKARIVQEGGSAIFMQLTATKCRAAASWIKDILIATNVKSWTLLPSPKADLPVEIKETIAESIEEEFKLLEQPEEEQAPPTPESQLEGPSRPNPAQRGPQEGPQQTPGQEEVPNVTQGIGQEENAVQRAQETLRDLNQSRRDIQDAIYEEIQKEATHEMRVMERQIEDQLVEGNYYKVLYDFIDDFCVFPTAFMKGPIITKKKRITWVEGTPEEAYDYIFMNKRISPFDIYPAPEATTVQDGSLCEHLRLSRSEIYNLIGVKTYKEDKIREALEEAASGLPASFMDSGIESEIADQEKRGNDFEANRNVIHGIHYFGSVQASTLVEWGVTNQDVVLGDPLKEWEVEAILVGNIVVKCELNDDPLLRRPYYSASYQSRPGSLWGTSLPKLMEDNQRMVNATVRALSNNMALASGPQIEIYIDRLADNGDIGAIHPFKIWQLTSDPSGGGGRAINFFQPESNAQELLEVYAQFEQKADDATGIPRYAYGNEKISGAAESASGLAMLLESASKGIKDAIRNIDIGVIIPRVEFQFYWNVVTNKIPFSGDVYVKALGSSNLTIKGSEQLKRNEFLQITANPIDQKIMGEEGRATILREMALDLGFVEDIIPTRLDMKKRIKEEAKLAEQAFEAEKQMKEHEAKLNSMASQIQSDGQKDMNQLTQETKIVMEQGKNARHAIDAELKTKEIESFQQENTYKSMATANKTMADNDAKDARFNKELAVKMMTGTGI